ncbi:cbb3-type cytochrome c oxidase subunit I [uncultured Ilumatobacter sp.]|uniref:cbb3-type cytochrome c oxidase subunit I n=1 Tax=uncultured Ilumatobacter sp. TaxID=879968 RepID=UPI00374FDB79
MTTIDPTTATADELANDRDGAAAPLLTAVADWLTSTDHKKIGRMFLCTGLIGLLGTIVVNVIVSLDRAGIANIDDAATPQLLDAQRVGLVFGTLLPLAVGLCVAVVPLQVGARAIAFPRLAGSGFWMWAGGLLFSIIALANNGGGLGGDPDMVDLFIGAHGLMAIGLAAVGASIAVTVLTTRAPGMTMRRVPFFSMSAMITGIGLVLVMPVLLGTLSYLFLDHRNGREAFGGNIGIYDWASWIFTQPVSFLFAIPALGVLAEGAALLFNQRTPARGVMYAGFALVGVAAFAGVAQQSVFSVSEVDTFGGDAVSEIVPSAFFNLLPLVGITVVLLMSLFLAKPIRGAKPNLTPAMVFGFFGVGMIMVGVLGNATYAIEDLGLQNSTFEEGVLVYVVYGLVLAALGGMAFWASKLWGVELPMIKMMPLAGLGVLAAVLASLPNYIAGFDQQRDVYDTVVAVGHALMALTVIGFIGLLAQEVANDDNDAVDDPYDGQTLEWATTSPAPTNNFVEPPTVMSAEPVADSKPNYGAGSASVDEKGEN